MIVKGGKKKRPRQKEGGKVGRREGQKRGREARRKDVIALPWA